MTPPRLYPEIPLSVVMPTLDQAPFIGLAIASVMEQGIPGLELLVQDGGSSDGTLEILADLAARHSGLRWVSEADDGPADALNRVIARARGAVIGWLNSDDLYTPGAAARALAWLQHHPDQVMVYGDAEHIDESGAVLGRYPSRDPVAVLATAIDGCHVCQPTVFFRREVVHALGGLDTGLRTAFDFDFWLRLIKAYPQGVGFVPEVQARSRLHEGSITMRLRERVALEGMQVVHRHVGRADAHWLMTHFDEVMATLPTEGATEPPSRRLQRLVAQSKAWLSDEAEQTLRGYLAGHRALQLARAELFADCTPDGWSAPNLSLRLRQPGTPFEAVQLVGRHASPRGGVLLLQVVQPEGSVRAIEVAEPGPFQLILPIHDREPGAQVALQLQCLNPFVPAEAEPGSDDRRMLGFQVESLELLPLR
jgi:hypothetical protein